MGEEEGEEMTPIYISLFILIFTLYKTYGYLSHIMQDRKTDAEVVKQETDEHLGAVSLLVTIYLFSFLVCSFFLYLLQTPEALPLIEYMSEITCIKEINGAIGLIFVLFNFAVLSLVTHFGNHAELSKMRLKNILKRMLHA